MSGKRGLSCLGAFALAIASGPLHAQASGQLMVAFIGRTYSVPVGGWAALGATTAVALAAFLLLQRPKAPRGIAGVVAASAALLAAWALEGVESAWGAQPPGPLPLASSPVTTQVPGGQDYFAATNVLPAPIRITAINCQSIGSPTSQIFLFPQSCTVGMSLPPGGVCYIYVSTGT